MREVIISGFTQRSVFVSDAVHRRLLAAEQIALADRLADPSSDLLEVLGLVGPRWIWETTDSVMWFPGLLRVAQELPLMNSGTEKTEKILTLLETVLIDPLANVFTGWAAVMDLASANPDLVLRVLRRHPLFRTTNMGYYMNPLSISLLVSDVNANSKTWRQLTDTVTAESLQIFLASFSTNLLAREMCVCLKPREKVPQAFLLEAAQNITRPDAIRFATTVIRETPSSDEMCELLGIKNSARSSVVKIFPLFKKSLILANDMQTLVGLTMLLSARQTGSARSYPWLASALPFLALPSSEFVWGQIAVSRLIASVASEPGFGQLFREHGGFAGGVARLNSILDQIDTADAVGANLAWCLIRVILHMVELFDANVDFFPVILRILRQPNLGGSTLAVASSALTRLIQHDPACIPQVVAAGLVEALGIVGPTTSSEAVGAIASCLVAICVHSEGEKEVLRLGNPICKTIVPLVPRMVGDVVCGEGVNLVGTALEELIRNKPDPWRSFVVDSLAVMMEETIQTLPPLEMVEVLQTSCKLIELLCANSAETSALVLSHATIIPNVFRAVQFAPPNFANIVPSHSSCKIFKIFATHSFQLHAKRVARVVPLSGSETLEVLHDWPRQAALVLEQADPTTIQSLSSVQFALQSVAMAMKDVPPTTSPKVLDHLNAILAVLERSLFEQIATWACAMEAVDKTEEEKELRRRIREDRPWAEALFSSNSSDDELVRGLWMVVRGFMCQAARVVNYPTVPKPQTRRSAMPPGMVAPQARVASHHLARLAISMLRLNTMEGVDLLCRLHVEDKHHMTRTLCVDTFYKQGGVIEVLRLVNLCVASKQDESLQSILWWFERTTSLKRMHNAQITHLLQQDPGFDAVALVSSLQAEFARGFAQHWRSDACLSDISAKASASLLKALTHVLEPNESVLASPPTDQSGLIASLIRRATASLLDDDPHRSTIWSEEPPSNQESSSVLASLFRSLGVAPSTDSVVNYVAYPIVLARAKDIARDFMERTLVLGASQTTAAAQTHIADVCVRLSHNKILQLGGASEEVVRRIIEEMHDVQPSGRARAGTVVVINPEGDTQERIDAMLIQQEEGVVDVAQRTSVDTMSIEEELVAPQESTSDAIDYSVFNTRHIAEVCFESATSTGYTILACLLHARFALCADIVATLPQRLLDGGAFTTSACICVEKVLLNSAPNVDYKQLFTVCVGKLGDPDNCEALIRIALICHARVFEERQSLSIFGLSAILKLHKTCAFEGMQAMVKKLIASPPIELELFRLEAEIVGRLTRAGQRGIPLSVLTRIVAASVCSKFIKLNTVIDGLVAWRERPDKRPRLDPMEQLDNVVVTLLPEELQTRARRSEPAKELNDFSQKCLALLISPNFTAPTALTCLDVLFLIESVCLDTQAPLGAPFGVALLDAMVPVASADLAASMTAFRGNSKLITSVQSSLKLIETLFLIVHDYAKGVLLDWIVAHAAGIDLVGAVLVQRALAIEGVAGHEDWVKIWASEWLAKNISYDDPDTLQGVLECVELVTRPPVKSGANTVDNTPPEQGRILAVQIAMEPDNLLLGGDTELPTEGLTVDLTDAARQLPQWYRRSEQVSAMMDDFLMINNPVVSVLFGRHIASSPVWSFPAEAPLDHPFITRSHTGATGSPVLATVTDPRESLVGDDDGRAMTEWLRLSAPQTMQDIIDHHDVLDDDHADMHDLLEEMDEEMNYGEDNSMEAELEQRLAEMEQADMEEAEMEQAHMEEADMEQADMEQEEAEMEQEEEQADLLLIQQTLQGPAPVQEDVPAAPVPAVVADLPSVAAIASAARRFGVPEADFVNLTGIDPRVLADLPEDMHAQIVAEYVSQLDPEVLAQLGPVPMDNATFLATVTQPEIRQEIFLTASEEFLSSLPPDLHAEAIMARERMSRAARRGRLARPSLVRPRHEALRSITEMFNRALVDSQVTVRPFGNNMTAVNLTAPAEEVADLMRMLGTRNVVRQERHTLPSETVIRLCEYYEGQIAKGRGSLLAASALPVLLKLTADPNLPTATRITLENIFFNLALHRELRENILATIFTAPLSNGKLGLFLVETIPAVAEWVAKTGALNSLIALLPHDEIVVSILHAVITKGFSELTVSKDSVEFLLKFLFTTKATLPKGTAIVIALATADETLLEYISSELLVRLNTLAGEIANMQPSSEEVSEEEVKFVELVRIVKKLVPKKLDEFDPNRASLWARLNTSLLPFDSIHGVEEPDSRTINGHAVVHHGVRRLFTLIEAFLIAHDATTASLSVLPTPSRSMSKGLADLPSASASELIEFVERHRRPLNGLIRESFELLNGPFGAIVRCCPWTLEFDNKRRYFREQLAKSVTSNTATTRLSVRRSEVFMDSYYQLRARSVAEMKGKLSVQFTGEEGVDAGGLVREWFGILAREIFNPNYALFRTAGGKASTFHPNPASFVNPDHLSFFNFCGRIMAKAILDDQRLDAYFTRSFYKHMLGSPVTWMDFEVEDPDYYKQLQWILNTDLTSPAAEGVVEHLTFTTEVDEFGRVRVVELVPNGANIAVTEESKKEFVRLVCEYKMTKAITPQVESFLKGFHELIPAALIGELFDDKELELLISGLPTINLADWKANTDYVNYTSSSPQIQWLWNVLAKDFSEEHLAWFLQFVTGSTQVPLEGFKALMGMRGLQRFSIHRAYGSDRLPTAHTCFNQLDLPEYKDEETLRDKLLKAVSEAHEGFGFI